MLATRSEGASVSVTLVRSGQIDAPFTVNVKNLLGPEPQHLPLVYALEIVAAATLHVAERLAERGDYPGHVV